MQVYHEMLKLKISHHIGFRARQDFSIFCFFLIDYVFFDILRKKVLLRTEKTGQNPRGDFNEEVVCDVCGTVRSVPGRMR